MTQKSILIITIGKTDLKLQLSGSDNKKYLLELSNDTIDNLNKSLLLGEAQCKSPWTNVIIPNHEEACNAIKAGRQRWHDDISHDYKKGSFTCKPCSTKNNDPIYYSVDHIRDNSILLPAKIAPVVRHINKTFKDADNSLLSNPPEIIMVMNTCRTGTEGSLRKGEPSSFGPAIAHWLAAQFECQYIGQVSTADNDIQNGLRKTVEASQNQGFRGVCGYVNFLDGNMHADGEGKDDPVSREALTRIDEMIKASVNCLRPPESNNKITLIYSPGGGFPKFKPQIEALCELHADTVLSWHEPQFKHKQGSANPLTDTQRYPSPDVSYRARKQCIDLIKKGNFQGAAAIAEFFTDSENPNQNQCDKAWAEAIEQASLWLQGRSNLQSLHQKVSEAQDNGNRINTKPILPFNLENEMPNTLWAAFRVESALLKGNIQDAIRFTCDISDIALQDLVGSMQKPTNYELEQLAEINDKNLRISLSDTQVPYARSLAELIPEHWQFKAKTVEKIITKDDYLVLNTNVRPQDESNLVGSLALNIVSELQQAIAHKQAIPLELNCSHPLQKFERRLSCKLSEKTRTLRQYRNQLTHGFMAVTETNNAKDAFLTSELWTKTMTGGHCTYRFLDQPLITNLYRSFHLPAKQNQPLAELYRHFTETLINILRNAPVDFEPESKIQEQKEPAMEH